MSGGKAEVVGISGLVGAQILLFFWFDRECRKALVMSMLLQTALFTKLQWQWST